MINTLVERSKLSPEQAARAIDDDFMPIYTAHFGELEVKLAAIWAKHFTPAEIQGLRDSVKDPSPQHQEVFKGTSLGRKVHRRTARHQSRIGFGGTGRGVPRRARPSSSMGLTW